MTATPAYRFGFTPPPGYSLDALVKRIPTVRMEGAGAPPFELDLDGEGILLRIHDIDAVAVERILKLVVDHVVDTVGHATVSRP